jgi:hypothetical protein
LAQQQQQQKTAFEQQRVKSKPAVLEEGRSGAHQAHHQKTKPEVKGDDAKTTPAPSYAAFA